MKNIIKRNSAFLVGALLTMGAFGAALPAQAAQVLSFTEATTNKGIRGEQIQWFAEELERRTNGELKVEIHWGQALLKAKAATKGIGAGAADMGFVPSLYNPKLHPGFLIGDLPMKYSDPWVVSRGVYDLATKNEQIKEEFDKLNLHFVTNFTTTQIQLICKDKVVQTIEDIEGIKFRGVSVYGKVFTELGGTPVSLSAYDAYQGLDTGLINCSQVYLYFIPTAKLQEVAQEVTLLDWGALTALSFAMNKDVWNNLSPEHQEIVTQLGSDFVDKQAEMIMKFNDQSLDLLKKGIDGVKVNVHEFSDEEKLKLIDAAAGYLAEWRKNASDAGLDADDIYNQYQESLKAYDEERQAKGHPWNR